MNPPKKLKPIVTGFERGGWAEFRKGVEVALRRLEGPPRTWRNRLFKK